MEICLITNHSRYHKIPLVVGRRGPQFEFSRTGEVDGSYSDNGKYQQGSDIDELMKNWNPSCMLSKLYKDREICN